MTDGISEIHRKMRDYQDWDAPFCWVCVRKYDESDMREHMNTHSVKEIIDCLVSWSIDSWKEERK